MTCEHQPLIVSQSIKRKMVHISQFAAMTIVYSFMIYSLLVCLTMAKNSTSYLPNGMREGGWHSTSNTIRNIEDTYECSGIPGATDC